MPLLPLNASGYISWKESIIKAIEICQHKVEWVKTDHAWLKAGNWLQVSNWQRKEFSGTTGIEGLKIRLIMVLIYLGARLHAKGCMTARSIQSRSWSHIEWKVSRDLGVVGLISRPWRSSIPWISLDTASRVSATSTVEFFSSFTQNHIISSILLFKLVKSISQRDMSTQISNRLSFLKLRSSGQSVEVWLICIKNLTVQYQFTFLFFFF